MINQQTKTITWKELGILLAVYLGCMIALVIITSLIAIFLGGVTSQKQLREAMSCQLWCTILTGLLFLLAVLVLAKFLFAWRWFIKNLPALILLLSAFIIASAVRGAEVFGAFISKFFWDVSLLGVGLAVSAVGISLFGIRSVSTKTPTNELIRLEATLNATKEIEQLEKLESEVRDRIAALKTEVDKIYNSTNC